MSSFGPSWLKSRQRLDQRITILRQGAGTNAMNEPSDDWAEVFSTRAQAYPSQGFERVLGDQNRATQPMTFEVRDEARTRGILPTDRVRWDNRGGQIFNVAAPIEQPERGRNLRIITSAEQ